MEGKFSELKEFEKHELGSQCKQDLDKIGALNW